MSITHLYDNICSQLDTGDIVLFSGNYRISSAVKLVTGSEWSHVGMVLRLPGIDDIMLWESDGIIDIKDIDSGEHVRGVRTVPLTEKISEYLGIVSVRMLDVERTTEMMEALHIFREEVKGRPYEKKTLESLKAAYDGPFGENSEDLSSLFCSELVAETYQRMGLLDEAVPSNEYTPKDFTDEGELRLSQGALGPQIRIQV